MIKSSNWTTNTKMKDRFLEILSSSSTEELKINVEGLEQLFSPSLKRIKDCIIITDKNVDEIEPYFENAIKMYGDKTGYEASNTETRINCFFENEISEITGVKIALMVLEVWALKLKEMDPESNFCLIMCSDESRVEIRFHKVRSDEHGWLLDDIESYKDGAVGYIIV